MVQGGYLTGQIFKPGQEEGKNASGDGIVYIASFHSLENRISDDIESKLELSKWDVLIGKIVIHEK